MLTWASLHDSQVAIPLATMTAQRVTNPRISDKGWIGQGSDQDLAELARYTRFSMWKCGSDIIARANRLPTR